MKYITGINCFSLCQLCETKTMEAGRMLTWHARLHCLEQTNFFLGQTAELKFQCQMQNKQVILTRGISHGLCKLTVNLQER